MQQKLLILITMLGLLSACSSVKKIDNLSSSGKSVDSPKEYKNLEKAQKVSLERTRILLDELIVQAQAKGGKAVEFLSNDLYIKGVDASMRGDSQTAAFLFEYTVKLNPEDDYVKRKYALELIRIGKLRESLSFLEKLFQVDKKDETLGLILGGVYTALEQSKKARPVYELVVKNNPKSEEACIFLAKSYMLTEDERQAKRTLNACIKRMPKNPMFPYFLGKMAVEKGKRKLAKKYFFKANKLDGNFYQAVIALGLFYEDESKLDKAIAIYKKYLDDDPNQYAILSRMVQVLFVKNDQLSLKARPDFEDMAIYVERLLAIDSSDLNLKVRLGIIYTDLGKIDRAKIVFKEILDTVPDSDKILYYLGALYQNTQEFPVALGYFGKIDTDSSLYLDSNVQIAKILHLLANQNLPEDKEDYLGQFENHVEKLSKVNDDLKLELNVQLATFYEGMNDLDKSIDLLEPLKKLSNWGESHNFYLASIYDKAMKHKKAEAIMREILVKDTNNAHALNFLGYSLLDRNGDLDEAFAYISKAVSVSPEDGYIRDSLGWFYYKTGKLEKALVEIKKAWSLVKTDAVITKHLAIVYKELKKYSKAKEFYTEALKYCKQQSEKDEVLRELNALEKIRLPASAAGQE